MTNPSSRDDRPLESLVAAATLAASSHNSQPWKFQIGEGRVTILPDLARRCPQVDPDDHHLYASLGCAAENLVTAARAKGWDANATVRSGSVGQHVVEVTLPKGSPVPSRLADAIAVRQCTRTAYDGRPVPSEALRLLERAGTGEGVSVLLITSAVRKETIASYVAQGNIAQIGDRAWRDELVSWIRFNEREARREGDGLWSKVTGNPEAPRPLGKLFMKLAFSAKSQNDKDVPWIRSSSGIVVFVSERDDAAHWVEAGRCYERFALQATALGIRNTFINQPVEVPGLRAQLASWLGLGTAQRPDFIVRFGYGPEMPRSMRRPIEAAIIRGSAEGGRGAASRGRPEVPPL